jgi:tripartite-type tricarboxylate transporter receptor subunit TctC
MFRKIICMIISAPGVFLACAGCGAFAQSDYPSKPIRLLVGFTPGGGTDIVARIVGPKLSEALNQQRIVIDNRPGASQVIASELAARASPENKGAPKSR